MKKRCCYLTDCEISIQIESSKLVVQVGGSSSDKLQVRATISLTLHEIICHLLSELSL